MMAHIKSHRVELREMASHLCLSFEEETIACYPLLSKRLRYLHTFGHISPLLYLKFFLERERERERFVAEDLITIKQTKGNNYPNIWTSRVDY